MAVQSGPNDITTDGLVFWIDGFNPKCYPGTGTVIKNTLLNNISGSLINGARYDGRSFVLDGVNDYIQTNFMMPTTHTISIFFKRTKVTYWQSLYGCENWNSNIGYLAYLTGASSIVVRGWEAISHNSLPVNTAEYNFYTITRSASGATSLYINGSLIATGTLTNTSIPNTLKIGARHQNTGTGAADFAGGNFSYFTVHNKVLTPKEIITNYRGIQKRKMQ